MDFKDLVQFRRSCRQYTGEDVSADDLQVIIRSALMSPTSRNRQSWLFAVVDDRTKIEKISDARESGSHFLRDASLCIIVLGNPDENDCWVEDGAIAAYAMQLQASDLGLGACWVQIRGRGLSDGTSANDIIHGILELPEESKVLCVVGLGHRKIEPLPKAEDSLKWENVIIDE